MYTHIPYIQNITSKKYKNITLWLLNLYITPASRKFSTKHFRINYTQCVMIYKKQLLPKNTYQGTACPISFSTVGSFFYKALKVLNIIAAYQLVFYHITITANPTNYRQTSIIRTCWDLGKQSGYSRVRIIENMNVKEGDP